MKFFPFLKTFSLLKSPFLKMASFSSESIPTKDITPLLDNLSLTPSLGYVDVHAHLIHEKFEGKEDEIAQQCIKAGMDFVILNGLEPESNRKILSFCEKYPKRMLPALGIYPLEAANNFIYTQEDVKKFIEDNPTASDIPKVNWEHSFAPPSKFDVDKEVDFIEEQVKEKKIVALGECGLDKYYLTDEVSFAEQERVLRKLMKVKISI